ncbi:MAG: hypothetical protein F7B20_03440 [Aeropyrum sp.]|nr:hypothetical protein [Aeropyrum sp.]MCE4615618.1 hypothetical protein [Aeropyrum sp.]
MKARVKILDNQLVLVETELGQKCVVPKSELCRLAERFGLEIEGYDCSHTKRSNVTNL